MILIAHRGNLNGPTSVENTPMQAITALNKGFHVELDVRVTNDKLFLGHDFSDIEAPEWLIEQKEVWWHAKNITTLAWLLNHRLTCFFHDYDDCTLTSNGYIWVYPGKQLVKNCIVVVKDSITYTTNELKKCYGVCSDYVISLGDTLND